jgi:hypothetical protein
LPGDTSTCTHYPDEKEFATNEESLDYARGRWQSAKVPYIVDKSTRQIIHKRKELCSLLDAGLTHGGREVNRVI